MSEDASGSVNVIAVTLVEDANAYEALARAHREAERMARTELLKARHHKHVEEIRAKLADLRAKLDRHKQAAATGS
jgi:hypothetical protein